MSIGGSGLTIGLLIAVMIATERKEMKEIAKLSIGPGLFNINEPVIFGMPIMLNPILAIPFIITPAGDRQHRLFRHPDRLRRQGGGDGPWTTPPLINAWLSTAGSMGAVVTQLICIVVAVLIYLPFVKIASRRAADAAQRQVDNQQTANPV